MELNDRFEKSMLKLISSKTKFNLYNIIINKLNLSKYTDINGNSKKYFCSLDEFFRYSDYDYIEDDDDLYNYFNFLIFKTFMILEPFEDSTRLKHFIYNGLRCYIVNVKSHIYKQIEFDKDKLYEFSYNKLYNGDYLLYSNTKQELDSIIFDPYDLNDTVFFSGYEVNKENLNNVINNILFYMPNTPLESLKKSFRILGEIYITNLKQLIK